MNEYFLGIDIGTFESKGVLIDENFNICASHSTKHSMDNPKPNYFEQDAEAVWWRDFCVISNRLVQAIGGRKDQIACVGISTLGTDCLPVDQDCRPLRPAILYGIDARASEEIDFLNRYYGEDRVLELFGHPLCSGDTATKILWIRNHESEIYHDTYKFLTGSSYITAKLTGKYVIDQFLGKGSFRPIYREDGSVNEELCRLYCRPDQVAECRYSTEIAGPVTEHAAKETGLMFGTPVITGTGDSTSEAVSVGLARAGDIFFQYGSSMYFYYCIDHPVKHYISPNGTGSIKSSKCFTVPGTFCIGDGTNAAGTLTKWVRDTFYREELAAEARGGENAYAAMAREAAEIPAGSEGLVMLPYIYGERSPIQDPDACGMLFGLTGKHSRKHINRAALEAVGYSTCQHIRLFTEMGIAPSHVITAGGGTKNSTWMQIISDILGMEITIPKDYQASSYGDAMMAAIGAGRLENFTSLKKSLPKGTVIKPNPENRGIYGFYYEKYLQLYLANRQLMHEFKEACNRVD